jgi:serine/threonine-protein kinase RsbT
MSDEFSISIQSRADIEHARRAMRELARSLGFDRIAVEESVLAISELATNLLRYAQSGKVRVQAAPAGERCGFTLESSDLGPGIDDLPRALQDGFSSGGGLGYGMGVVCRTMDSFDVETSEMGTRITTHKWRPSHT